MAKRDFLKAIGPDEAMAVLEQLVALDPEIRRKAQEIAMKVISDIDADEVADQVFWELDAIAVEDVWDGSGQTREGYVDPGDYAWQLFEEALEPFIEQLRKCEQVRLTVQAKLCCMGILEGIHRFETESESEFKEWAVDAPGQYFVSVYREWRKGSKSNKHVSEVKRLVQKLSPERAKLCR
jgi:hypothetical protein